MILKWNKVLIQVLENDLIFCVSIDGEETRIEQHASKESMEYSINEWIKFNFPACFGEETEFEIIRYR